MKRYRFDMRGAHEAGAKDHPQLEIRRLAPDATDFEPVTIADCWLFSAAEIGAPLPDYIREVKVTRQ